MFFKESPGRNFHPEKYGEYRTRLLFAVARNALDTSYGLPETRPTLDPASFLKQETEKVAAGFFNFPIQGRSFFLTSGGHVEVNLF
jgi:hypothetical protein